MSAPALPRAARPDRPAFHDDPGVDRLVAIVVQLTAELSALADRVAVLEELGTSAGWLKPGAIEAHQPDEAGRQRAEQRREALVARVFAILEDELERAGGAPDDRRPAYWQAVAAVEGKPQAGETG